MQYVIQSVSVVIPVYSGAAFLAELVERIGRIRDKWINDEAPLRLVELICVDDAAVDDSPAILDGCAMQHPWIRVLHLSRNYGQHPATIAGILYSSGDWVVTLDEDLQHPPEKLQAMLALATSNGLDVVYANPKDRVHESTLRDLGSVLFKRFVAFLSGDRNVGMFNSFRLIRGSIARAASSVCSHETYFDVALGWYTQRLAGIDLAIKDQRVIDGGRSGYSLRKLLSHARRLLMSTQVKLLRTGALFGIFGMLAGLIVAAGLVLTELLHPGIFGGRGWGSVMTANLVFGGMTLLLVGVALEYLATLVLRAQGKPVFFAVDRSNDEPVRIYLANEVE